MDRCRGDAGGVAGRGGASGRTLRHHPWCDTSLSPAGGADLLLDALTPAERIGLLAGDNPRA